MFLKNYPNNVEIGELVEITMTMMQTTLWRVYEIVECERRPLSDDDRIALESLVALYGITRDDVKKLKKRMAN